MNGLTLATLPVRTLPKSVVLNTLNPPPRITAIAELAGMYSSSLTKDDPPGLNPRNTI